MLFFPVFFYSKRTFTTAKEHILTQLYNTNILDYTGIHITNRMMSQLLYVFYIYCLIKLNFLLLLL